MVEGSERDVGYQNEEIDNANEECDYGSFIKCVELAHGLAQNHAVKHTNYNKMAVFLFELSAVLVETFFVCEDEE